MYMYVYIYIYIYIYMCVCCQSCMRRGGSSASTKGWGTLSCSSLSPGAHKLTGLRSVSFYLPDLSSRSVSVYQPR